MNNHYYVEISHPANRAQVFFLGKKCQTGHYISESLKCAAQTFLISEIDFPLIVRQMGSLAIIRLIPCELA